VSWLPSLPKPTQIVHLFCDLELCVVWKTSWAWTTAEFCTWRSLKIVHSPTRMSRYLSVCRVSCAGFYIYTSHLVTISLLRYDISQTTHVEPMKPTKNHSSLPDRTRKRRPEQKGLQHSAENSKRSAFRTSHRK